MSIVLSESETESEILWLRTAGIRTSGKEVSAPVHIAIWHNLAMAFVDTKWDLEITRLRFHGL